MVKNMDVDLLGPDKPEERMPRTTLEEIEDDRLEIPPELEFIRDIPMKVSVELGRTEIKIKDLIQLYVNQIIEVEKTVGEPLQIYINGQIIARGEVVVINDKFGLRLTDIVNPMEQGLQG